MSKRSSLFMKLEQDSIIESYRCSFVTPSQNADVGVCCSSIQYRDQEFVTGLSGCETRKFYEDLVSEESRCPGDVKRKVEGKVTQRRLKKCDSKTSRRLTNDLLKASSCGNVSGLEICLCAIDRFADRDKIINGVDRFGWNAIMCAAADGFLSAVQYLIRKGCCYRNVYDNTGKDIREICRQKGQYEVISYLNKLDRERRVVHQTANSEVGGTTVDCELCDKKFPAIELCAHNSSVVHLFNDQAKQVRSVYGIPEHNRGFQMLLRGGWHTEKGLGPTGRGRKNPIRTINKQNRYGFGLVRDKERVSHFSAYDTRAVKRKKEVVSKDLNKRTFVRRRAREKRWEQNLRRHMTTDE